MKDGLLGLFLTVNGVLAVLFVADYPVFFQWGWLIAGFVALSVLVSLAMLLLFKKQPARTLILSIGTLCIGLGVIGAMGAFYGFARVMGG